MTDDDGLVRILEIPKTFYARSRHEVRLTEGHLIPAETWIIQSRVHLSEVKQVLLKLPNISLHAEHQRDEVLRAGGKQVEESFEDGETVGNGEEGGG